MVWAAITLARYDLKSDRYVVEVAKAAQALTPKYTRDFPDHPLVQLLIEAAKIKN